MSAAARDPTPTSFEPLDQLAARVRDGMTLAVGGTLFTRMPVRLLAAVCDARPRDLHYACWGGGLPLEMLLEAGAVSKATLCFSSLDIFGQAPRFQAAALDGGLELIEWTAHAFAQALSAGKRRLPSEPFTWPTGSDLADLPTFPAQVADPVSGTPIGAAPALRPDVLLLHAPAADEDGNIVLVGARAMDLVMVPASRQVLATVDAVVPRDELRRIAGRDRHRAPVRVGDRRRAGRGRPHVEPSVLPGRLRQPARLGGRGRTAGVRPCPFEWPSRRRAECRRDCRSALDPPARDRRGDRRSCAPSSA